MVKDAGALFLVDAVTHTAARKLKVDEWGIDAVYSGTKNA